MAQKVQVVLVDDLDSGPADETLSFGLDGVSYEIDLNNANAAKLRDALALYVGSGRRISGGRGRRPRAGGAASSAARGRNSDAAKIREWARQNGHQVSERGRVSAEIRSAFQKAHG